MAGKASVDWQNRRADQDEPGDWPCPINRAEPDAATLHEHWVQEAPDTDPLVFESLRAEAVATSGQRRQDYSLVWLGLAISAGLHAVLLAVLLLTRASDPAGQTVLPEIVRINLVPPQPRPDRQQLAPSAPAVEPAPTSALTPAPAPTEAQDSRTGSPPPQPVRQPDVQPGPEASPTVAPPAPVQTAELPLPEEGVSNLFERDSNAPQAPSSVPLPSAAAVRSQLRQMQQSAQDQAWRSDCTRRQAQSDVLDCPEEGTPDYGSSASAASAPRQAIYRALNPVRSVSRTQRSLPTVAANIDGLAERLADSDITEGLADYLLEQTTIGITDGSNSGNRAVEHMRRMTDKSAAAEQARMLLSDPWVITRSRELEQRKVFER